MTDAASARAVQAAESAMQRDETALRATQSKLLTSYGRALIHRKDLPEFVTALAAGQMALVRLVSRTLPPSDIEYSWYLKL